MHPSVSDSAIDQRATEFRLHGPLTLIHDGISTEVPLGGPRELLAMLLLQPYRSPWLDMRTTQDVLGDGRAFEQARIRLSGLLEGTGLEVSASRSTSSLRGPAYRTDLDTLIRLLRQVETADSITEVMDIVDRAADVGPGAPLEGLEGTYFRTLRDGLAKVWREAAFGWLCAARIAGLPAKEERLRQLFIDKVPKLESAMPAMALVAESTLESLEGDDWSRTDQEVVAGGLAAIKAVTGRAVSEIERHVFKALLEAKREARRAPYRNLNPRTTALSTLEVSIYLGDGQAYQAVEAAVEGVLAEADMVAFGHQAPEIGSWFRKFWAGTREATGHLNAEQVAAELERKIRIEVFDKAQAVIDNQQATGAAALIASLQGESHACIRVGSLLVLKVDGQVLVNTLTQYQLAWLERNQNLLRDPTGLLRGLEKLTAEPQHTSGVQLPASDLADIEIESSSP